MTTTQHEHELTINLAQALLIALDTKRKPGHWHWYHSTLFVYQGRGQVDINSNAAQPTIAKWFESVGLLPTRFEARGDGGWRVWFHMRAE